MASSRTNKTSQFHTYLRLFQYIKPLYLPLTISFIGFAVFAASQPMLAKLMEMVVGAINAKNVDARWTLPLYAIGIFIIRGIGSFLGTYFNTYVGARMVTNIRIDMFNHLSTLPVRYFHEHSDGEIFQRLSGGINLISNTFTDAVRTMIREGLTVIFLLIYVFYLNWKLSLTFLLVAPPLLLVLAYTAKRFRKLTRKNENIMSSLLQTISELISGHEVMRIFGGHAYEQQRHKEAAERSLNNMLKIRKIAALSTPVIQLLVAISMALIISLLLSPSILASYSSEQLIGYLTAVALVPKSLKQLSGLNVPIQRGIAGAELIFKLLDQAPEIDRGTHVVERAKGRISVKDVCFRYNAGQELVLNHISFDIAPGEVVALVGKSGSGKTTLTALLQRFYDVEDGSITLDGVDVRDYQLVNLRSQIALVSQHLVLFNDTIRNNIAYGSMRNVSDDSIHEAARRAHALEFIEKLPDGFDTVIGDNGLQLSGGQRQRIAIARAFLKNAPILILDEATSALDNQSEQHIQEALKEVMRGRTTIVIAHRLSTIENADSILVLSKGTLVEQGSHRSLLERNGVYANLYQKGLEQT